MAIHSTILAWRIPWTEESGRLWSTGSQRVGHNWSALAHIHPLLNSSCYRIFYSAFFSIALGSFETLRLQQNNCKFTWFWEFMIFYFLVILLKNVFSKLYISYKSLKIFSSNIFAEPHCGRVGGNLYAPCSLIFFKKNRVIIFSTAIKSICKSFKLAKQKTINFKTKIRPHESSRTNPRTLNSPKATHGINRLYMHLRIWES